MIFEGARLSRHPKSGGQNAPPTPNLLGKDEVGDAYGGVQFLPSTFYIGRDGKIVKSNFGILGESDIEDNIKLALASALATGQQNATSSAQQAAAPRTK